MFRYGVVYLVVMAVLWGCALPSYLSAVDGVTDQGDPTGSLWYTLTCFAIAGLCLAAALSVADPGSTRSVFGRTAQDPVRASHAPSPETTGT